MGKNPFRKPQLTSLRSRNQPRPAKLRSHFYLWQELKEARLSSQVIFLAT